MSVILQKSLTSHLNFNIILSRKLGELLLKRRVVMKFKKAVSVILAAVFVLSAGITENTNQKSALAAESKSRVSVHDPSVFKDEQTGTYYVFGSHIEAAKSADLQNWTSFANGYAKNNNVLFGDLSQNLKGAFDWAGEDLEDCVGGYAVWAPDVIYNPDYINKDGSKGAYLMYFCTSSTYMRSVIAFAASKSAEGPYEFVDTLIYSGFTENDSYATSTTKNVNRKYTSTNIDELIAAGEVTYNSDWFSSSNYNNYLYPNAIDPTIYYDTDGKMYMCYGSWSGGIFTLEMNPETGRCIHPETGKTADGRMVDSYFGTKISGGYYKSGEGPFIEYNADTGYYYLWTTYGGLFSDGGYNMRVFRSDNPLGPFYDAAGKPAVLEASMSLDSVGLKVMGNHKFSSLSTAYMACGHNSVLKDDDGQWYLFNHVRFNDGTEYHEVRVHSMYFNSESWPVVAPYEYSGDKMSETGYNTNDITGEYEFINHGNDTSSAIHEYSLITLNDDGTVSGSASGTWSQADDSSAAEITISGQKYYGYFMGIHDESGTDKKVMAFSAVGSNNQTVWGVKNTAAGSDIEREDLYTLTINDLPEEYRYAADWIWRNRIEMEQSTVRRNTIFDQIVAGNGTLNYIVRWQSYKQLTYEQRQQFEQLLSNCVNGWTDWLVGYENWPYEHVEVKIVGWAVIDKNCLINLHDNEIVYDDTEYYDSQYDTSNGIETIPDRLPLAPTELSRFEHFADKSYQYPGGIDKRFDMYMWATQGFPAIGGCGGDWGQRLSDNAYLDMINSGVGQHVLYHEIGHGFGMTDFYGGEGEANGFPPGGFPGGENSLMMAGSASKITDFDGWMLRYIWTKIKDESERFDIPVLPIEPGKTAKGDVNADGAFDISDAVTLQKYILGKGSLVNFSNGDMNNDNIIDIFDVTAMKKLLK